METCPVVVVLRTYGPVITAVKAGAMKKDEDFDAEEKVLLLKLEVGRDEEVEGVVVVGGGGGGGGEALLDEGGGGGGGGEGGAELLAAAGLGLSSDWAAASVV